MGGTLTRSESPRLLGKLVVNSFVTIFRDPNHRHKIPTHAKLSFVVCLQIKSLFDNRKSSFRNTLIKSFDSETKSENSWAN